MIATPQPASLSEIAHAFVSALGDVPAIAWSCVLAGPILAWLVARQRGPVRRGVVVAILAGMIVAAACVAFPQAWVGDDAYIAFRYSRNLVDGHGLVFNVGERVEGYTAYLWCIAIAAAMVLRIHPVVASLALGFAAQAVAIVTAHVLVTRLTDGDDAKPLHRLPGIAPMLVAGTAMIGSHAVSGLETVAVSALTLLALERAQADRPLLAGLFAILATMTHPDHAVFYAAIGASLLLTRARFRSLVAYAVPFVVVYIPYYAWRWHFYGDTVPNTFHVKSGDLPYFSQGIVYLVVSALALGLWAVLPAAIGGAWLTRRSRFTIACAIGLPLYLFYMTRIGGDFMLARLMVTPAILLATWAGAGFARLAITSRVAASVVGGIALAALVPVVLIPPGQNRWFLADEGSYYRLISLHPPRVDSTYALEAEDLKRELIDRGLTPRLATHCIGIVGYETRLPILDLYGLASREVGAIELARRARPGHEKSGSPGHILQGGAELSQDPVYPPPYEELTRTRIGHFDYYLPHFEPLGPELARRKIARDAPVFLASWLRGLDSRSLRDRACDTWFAREYWFRGQPSSELSVEWAGKLGSTLDAEDAEAILVRGESPASRGERRVQAWDFEHGHEGWSCEGQVVLRDREVPGQEKVWPVDGTFLTTLPAITLDGAAATCTSDSFVVDGDLITLRLGGRGSATVALIDDQGKVLRSAAPCGCDLVRDEAWDVRDLRGREVSLAVVDQGPGYVVVDDIVEWTR